jgi:hypothetical protein
MPLIGTFTSDSINGWRSGDYVESPYSQIATIVPGYNTIQNFGASIATTSDFSIFVVGAPTYSSFTSQAGIVYIFTGSPSTGVYTQVQTIQSSDLANFDSFGESVDISEDKNYIIVGAGSKASGAGAAYVFVKSGGTYVQQQKIVGAGGSFGSSVSIDDTGNYLIVGAPQYDSGLINNIGRVDIFSRSGSTWTSSATYTGQLLLDNRLGCSVYMNGAGDRVWIGQRSGSSGPSTIHTATRSGITWSSLSSIPLTSGVGDAFVEASPDGQYVTAVANYQTTYILKYVISNWVIQTTVPTSAISFTGTSAPITDALPSISNDRFLMKTRYLYRGIDATWNLNTTFYSSDGSFINGPTKINSLGTYFAGAVPNATINGIADNGALYIFSRT